jgi:hypothetical protein
MMEGISYFLIWDMEDIQVLNAKGVSNVSSISL